MPTAGDVATTRCGSVESALVWISIGRPGPTASGASGVLPFDEPDEAVWPGAFPVPGEPARAER
jgi:hypothetical protein